MSKRAEEKSWKAYPDDMGTLQEVKYILRMGFVKGYKQAEKDTIERACDLLMNYVFEEVTMKMRDHFRKRLEEE